MCMKNSVRQKRNTQINRGRKEIRSIIVVHEKERNRLNIDEALHR